MAITISERAAERIQELVRQSGNPELGLRIKVVGGGCSGLQYKMDLDTERAGDKVFGTGEAKVIVDRRSFLYLNGTELDYHDALVNAGFTLRNPNVKRTCGCGASFAV
ncbi:MAG: iron-sulfur-binding protein [Candidatus Binatia bacterium]|jgi:iron-sulfur cluster assembly protein|nr:MAG: iron-sulfur-binding protein [Candidatus Binatia bacterium]